MNEIVTTNNDGTPVVISDPLQIVTTFNNFWKNLYNSKIKPNHWCHGYDHPLDGIINTWYEQAEDWALTFDDFERALNKMKTHKAPGKSGLGPEVFKAMPMEMRKDLFQFYEYCFKEHWIPDEWRHSIVVLIPKDTEVSNVANYRPIALQETSYKLFAMMLLEKALEHAERYKIIEPLQFGARPNVALQQALLTFQATIEDANQFGKDLHVLFIDFTKAFDSVEHWILIKTLLHYGFPDNFVQIIKEIYKNNTAEFFTPLGSSGEKFILSKGIKQGDVLSPLLFNIYMNLLLTALRKSKKGYKYTNNHNLSIPAIMFVDDLTLISETKEDMEELLDIVQAFCKDTGMTINTKKTTYTTKFPSIDPLSLEAYAVTEGNSLTIRPSSCDHDVRLLGVYYNLKLDFQYQQNLCIKTLRSDLNKIRNKCFTAKQKCTLINQVFIPKVNFRMNTFIFDYKNIEKMDNMMKNLLAHALNIPNVVSKETLWRRCEDLGFGLNSLADEQLQAFLSTALNHGLNTEHPYPRTLLAQRLADAPQIDWEKITRKTKNQLTNNNFLQNLLTVMGILKEYAIADSLHFDPNNTYKTPVYPTENIMSDLSKHQIWHHPLHGSFVPIFTDGSLRNRQPNNIATSAVYFKDGSPLNWSGRTIGKQTPINSELNAIEKAISLAPLNKNCVIFSDCKPAIDAINNLSYSVKYKSENRAICERISQLINQRKKSGRSTEIVWVPAHTKEDKNITPSKKARIETLSKTYDRHFSEIIQGNDKVDKLAQNTNLRNIIRNQIPVDPRLPEGLPPVNLIVKDKAFQGNLRKHIKQSFKDYYRDIKLRNSKYPNHHDFEIQLTGQILKSTDYKLAPIQQTIMQTSTNLTRNPLKLFQCTLDPKKFSQKNWTKEEVDKLKSKEELKNALKQNNQKISGNIPTLKQRLINGTDFKKAPKQKALNFSKIRSKLLHHSPECLEPDCQMKIADFFHMIQHPLSQKEQEELLNKINNNINRHNRPNTPKCKIEKFWVRPSDGDLSLPSAGCDPPTDLDSLVIKAKLVLNPNHLERRRNAENSIKKAELKRVSINKEVNARMRATLGYFPKHIFKMIQNHIRTNSTRSNQFLKEAKRIATEFLIAQMTCWKSIIQKFWKSRFKILGENIDLRKLKTSRRLEKLI